MAQHDQLLVKVRGDAGAVESHSRRFGIRRSSVRPILTLDGGASSSGLGMQGAETAVTWLAVDRSNQFANPWDEAHALLQRSGRAALAGAPEILLVEPNVQQRWPYERNEARALGMLDGRFTGQSNSHGQATVPGRNAWHLDDDFSGFAQARKQVGDKQRRVRVAHLDTGYDPGHASLPAGLNLGLQLNTIPEEAGQDAVDRAPRTGTANRGHGLGTMGILAGDAVSTTTPGWENFGGGAIGCAPGVDIVPIRVADWVVRFTTETLVAGIQHACDHHCHVLSLSMGGLSSAALADAINLAYLRGITMVAAAGNHFSGIPMPASVVFPARYDRVIAACGIMADGAAYHGLRFKGMQGNHGPNSAMATALGAYTPNIPWPEIDSGVLVDMDGAGTSSATPQVAAAAALWLAEHGDALKSYSGWERVEAVRHALFQSAGKSTVKMGSRETFETIGNGVLNAYRALSILPLDKGALRQAAVAKESWSWLDLLFNRPLEMDDSIHRRRMLALELTQIAQTNAAVDKAMPDNGIARPSDGSVARYLEAVLDEGLPSQALRDFLENRLGRPPRAVPKAPAASRVRRTPRPAPPPPPRRLRIYALDPSIGKELASVSVHEATVSLPWDDEPTGAPLRPGPIGEYVEVIDIDPASNQCYPPVDLNAKGLLAQDGLVPSEGNPQFHQQMVYAVAMTTIGNFERALGRRAIWAPHWDTKSGEAQEVRRLRIYPHALRTPNAYYSPDKVALLFGYFQSDADGTSATPPGSMVFTCLSSDIIAHEMSHALLDGLHRRFQEASNPDVPAFHEAFADIVALFQHFSLEELVRFEIGRTKGDVSAANLLNGLAKQFGEGSGRAGPLRDYGTENADLDYATTMSPHARGSILVFAVYEAFLAIVAGRIADLTHLATGGTGVLPAGAMHPGLVDGLTKEVAKTAAQVLRMCIRALDYAPPVDITFGEYLRAIITADLDAYPDDPMHYRIAFMESFRRWGLLPTGVKTVSDDTLSWSAPDNEALGSDVARSLIEDIDLGWNQKLDRSQIFQLNERNRWKLWNRLDVLFAENPELMAQFGLLDNVPRFNNEGKIATRSRKIRCTTTFEVHGVRPARRVEEDGSFRTDIIAVLHQRVPLNADGSLGLEGVETSGRPVTWFRGGATVIFDPTVERPSIRFSIIKNTGSETRRRVQSQTIKGSLGASPLRSLYFSGAGDEPFALLHSDVGGDGYDW